ncbi:PTS glucose transporter subunit IIA [Enterococcus faecalis]|uniref:PTS sugar transporter subunit IIA n=1 Tax=Enterococcus faecalis TaxID=1351 RepID=UPI0025AFBF99|nr:PTS glucose transporter subunit IIA [Enterococcus faecalis]MDN3201492.1 PTS glucose transporter subunit IIA [Enterococcus faecalis]
MFNLFKNKKQEGISITAPCSGRIIPISEVNDPIFSKKVLGEGFAVVPEDQMIYAPLAGHVTSVFPTKHALGIKSEDGIEYLIHIGIDTVELQGKPFTILIKEGDRISLETPLVKVNFDEIKKVGKDNTVIIVFTKKDQINEILLSNKNFVHGEICGSIRIR